MKNSLHTRAKSEVSHSAGKRFNITMAENFKK
jgi:hypothetical protein